VNTINTLKYMYNVRFALLTLQVILDYDMRLLYTELTLLN